MPVLDARRHLQGQRAPGADPAVAAAVDARVGDDRAEALARGARPSRHHLAQERPGDLLDLAAALADVAPAQGRAGLGALAGARRADDGRVDLDVAVRAEGRLDEVDLEPDHRVAPRALARPRAALRPGATEERVHDVGEAEALAEAAAPAPGERVGAEVVASRRFCGSESTS